MATESDLRYDAGLRWQPMRQLDTIVGSLSLAASGSCIRDCGGVSLILGCASEVAAAGMCQRAAMPHEQHGRGEGSSIASHAC